MKDENKIFFVGQKVLINNSGEILVLITPEGGLDFPGGQIKNGEINLLESLKREVKEETNLDISVSKPFKTFSIDFTNKNLYFVFYLGSFVSGELKLSNEHTDYHWVNRENFKKLKNNSIWFSVLEEYFQSVQ